MPKRKDLKKIMIIGAGPIIIGQACEFDYSGTQGVKALKEEGYEVVLLNSNPATIMTDPSFADATYIEPITPEIVTQILEKERPQALLPTLGGQTALNVSVKLAEAGVLDRLGIELIGANVEAIKKAEDRKLFKEAMEKIGLKVPVSSLVHNKKEAQKAAEKVGFPLILRPAFTLGGMGGGIVYKKEDYEKAIEWALECSPVSQVLVEQSVLGWKEFELEVMRDTQDNVVIICSIENLDPMGVHTGDSITVAPAQTLTDREYQVLRNASIDIIREIGVDTGGSNIQFAVNPKNGDFIVIEMNPRVSRSSALASKATGFPIAKIAAKLAVGYRLDEIPNDITRSTPASFEPTIDYVVTKCPRFAFEKFPQADDRLTTQMKSVGEVMAIGRTFKESFQKALRSLEIGISGLEPQASLSKKELEEKISVPKADRILWVAQGFRENLTVEKIHELSFIDPWFLGQIQEIVEFEKTWVKEIESKNGNIPKSLLYEAKQKGFSDHRLAALLGKEEDKIYQKRKRLSIKPVYKRVDTCGAEFIANTPYLYSTYEEENEAAPTDKKKIIILGGGPNRIGQGIEFDYCCVHACFALSEIGYETIMVNCNPETVSTDYDTSDRLYFEPLTFEDVTRIIEEEKPEGIIVQLGGQTPLNLAKSLENWGAKILGTSPDSIDQAEDRKRFSEIVEELKLKQPQNGIALSEEEAFKIANKIGYPVLVRPSYVLGGRAMEIVYDQDSLSSYMKNAVRASANKPVLIDKFLEDAIEVDVDAIADGKTVFIAGIMEHIERAGIHSGDSACCLPPHSLSEKVISKIRTQTRALAKRLNVIGLMNVQFAVKEEEVYLIEVNPRASRTVPFVSKAIGIPVAKIAAKVMAGKSLRSLGIGKNKDYTHFSVKEAVFPFNKFPGVDTLLSPEMKSTGEVMGIDHHFGMAFAKAQMAAGNSLPLEGSAFLSVRDHDKEALLEIAKKLKKLNFHLIATKGTAVFLEKNGLEVEKVNKLRYGSPHTVDYLEQGKIQMLINTHEGKKTAMDSYAIRRTALSHNIPYFTTIAAAEAAVSGIEALQKEKLKVYRLQSFFT